VAQSPRRSTSSAGSSTRAKAGAKARTRKAPASTKARSKVPAGSRTKPKSATNSRSTAKRAPAKRAAPKAREAQRGGGDAVRTAFEGHQADVWGLVLVTMGILGGLALYGGAGPGGASLARFLSGAVGLFRYLVPPILVLAGIALIQSRPTSPRDRAQGGEEALVARLLVGLTFIVAGSSGFLHVVRGPLEWESTVEDLGPAGGLVGALIGEPLRTLFAGPGAVLVLVTVVLLGGLALVGMPIRVAVGHLISAVRWVSRLFYRGLGVLFEMSDVDYVRGDDETLKPRSEAEPEVVFFDQDRDARPAGRRRRRADKAQPPEKAKSPAPVEEQDPPAPLMPRAPVKISTGSLREGSSDPELEAVSHGSAWRLPPKSLLVRSDTQKVDQRAVEAAGRTLEAALAAHGVETRLVGMVVGPTVTRYELELGPGVKVAKVTSLHKDIAYAMASADVRILAPIPGRQAIGVEVPNPDRQIVALGDILTSPEAVEATHPLEVALGRDINGRSVLANLATMPHLLIAGATGAGKSSGINSLITSILVRTTPDQVRMILVDPKRVELGQYNRLPHLLTQVVTDPKKAANALAWAVKEMEKRYDLLSEVGVRDITGYNAAYDRGDLSSEVSEVRSKAVGPGGDATYPRLPFILIVVDELNDLMMVAARDVEDSIVRIAQMARAVGIHLVIATQRPSVNVITGVIKANVPARLAFAVSSLADSRVILDQPGAERLVGRGDMLLLGPSSSSANRLQGAWVTEEEVRAIAAHWRRQVPDSSTGDELEVGAEDQGADDPVTANSNIGSSADDDGDELLAQARDLIVRSQLGSTSMLQRKLRVGFARAGRIMDLLEQQGVVGPSTGSKARDVLMSPEELDGGDPGLSAHPDAGPSGE